ncbi:MAG TPA: glycosyltransferase family 87 protein [Candidatus Limnocylindria bacterium]|nr:glycosyltransferase family 87 protein [Candidatus Limnocylindria bacterium]
MRRAGILGVIAIAASVALVVLGAIGVPATAYRDGDFLQFWIQPQALFEGASPYDPAWWAAIHGRVGGRALFAEAVYPPYDAFAFLPLALVPLSYAAALWLVAQLVAVAAVAVGLARRISDRAGQGVFLAVVVSFQPLWLLVVGGNVTGFLFAALGGAYLAALDRRFFRCGALLGLLVVKPHPFVFLAVAVLVCAERAERRALGLGALATAGPLVGVTLLLRPSWYAEWLPAALGLQAAPGSNATVWTIGRLIGIEAPLLPLIGGVVALALIVAFGVWSRRTRRSLALAIAVAIPVSLAVPPHGWSYDQLQLLIPLAVLVDRIGGGSPTRRAARAALVLGASALPWLLYLVAFRRGGEELSVITSLAVFALLLFVLDRFRSEALA